MYSDPCCSTKVVTPALFWKFGRKVAEKQRAASGESEYKDEQMLRLAAQFDDRRESKNKITE